MYNQIKKEIGLIKPGLTQGYYLLVEKETETSACPDGLDRHGFCTYIFDGDERVIKYSYADYPWH